MQADAKAALDELYKDNPGAKALGKKAKGILVFPEIIKGGFIFGGQYGDGTLFKRGRAKAYYRSFAASYGLQAGIQKLVEKLLYLSKILLILHKLASNNLHLNRLKLIEN